jgi:hypothetical protein
MFKHDFKKRGDGPLSDFFSNVSAMVELGLLPRFMLDIGPALGMNHLP